MPLLAASIIRFKPMLGPLSLVGVKHGTKRRSAEMDSRRGISRAGHSSAAASHRTAPRLPRSRCELRAVGEATRLRYDKVFDELVTWSGLQAADLPGDLESIEELLLEYFDVLLERQAPAHEAECAVAAIVDRFPVIPNAAAMPRVRRALKGYRRARPPRSRAPIAKEIMAALAQILMASGNVMMSVLVVMLFFTYCRPGELRLATRRQLLPPVRSRGPLSRWSLTVAPQEDQPLTPQAISKTGTMDDTILLDQPPWMAPLVKHHFLHLKPQDRLFDIPTATTVLEFQKAARLLGLESLCLYQLRHGGASEDLLGHLRPLDEIQARGRWRTMSSLRRYAKPAQLHRLLNSLDQAKLSYARESWEHLPDIMLQTRKARLPYRLSLGRQLPWPCPHSGTSLA